MEENIKRLIQRYENKIQWLEIHKTMDNTKHHNGLIQGLETAIYDLNDLLYGIDM
jgi:hypothetical protein